MDTYDQSNGSTKTKYIKLNTKTQIFFCYLNENLMTFLYTLIGATRKQKEKKKVFFLKCITKSNVIFKNWVLVFSFMYLVSVDPMDWSNKNLSIWFLAFLVAKLGSPDQKITLNNFDQHQS